MKTVPASARTASNEIYTAQRWISINFSTQRKLYHNPPGLHSPFFIHKKEENYANCKKITIRIMAVPGV
jgi:hypothetical protein